MEAHRNVAPQVLFCQKGDKKATMCGEVHIVVSIFTRSRYAWVAAPLLLVVKYYKCITIAH